jgi:hypothetical protein
VFIPADPTNEPPSWLSTRKFPPAYLEGKNPYGNILKTVEHPYQKPEVTPNRISSKTGDNDRGRSDTPISIQPRAASAHDQVGRRKPDSSVLSAKELPALKPTIPTSVKAAKEFFESRGSGREGAPPSSAKSATAPRGALGGAQLNRPSPKNASAPVAKTEGSVQPRPSAPREGTEASGTSKSVQGPVQGGVSRPPPEPTKRSEFAKQTAIFEGERGQKNTPGSQKQKRPLQAQWEAKTVHPPLNQQSSTIHPGRTKTDSAARTFNELHKPRQGVPPASHAVGGPVKSQTGSSSAAPSVENAEQGSGDAGAIGDGVRRRSLSF